MSRARRLAATLCALVLASTATMAQAATPTASASAGKAAAARAPVAAAASAPKVAANEFAGQLAVGKTYVSDVRWDGIALHIWRPGTDMIVAKNTAWTIAWDNLDKFPALATPVMRARPQRFTFKVVKADVSSGSPKMPWTHVYHCELISYEPIAGSSPPPPKKR